jgi:hypothetical protein
MFGHYYNISTFSNKEGAPDRISQRKAIIAKLHSEFNGEPEMIQQHLAEISHRCEQCGITDDFNFIIKENPPPASIDINNPKSMPSGNQILIVMKLVIFLLTPPKLRSPMFKPCAISFAPRSSHSGQNQKLAVQQ